MVNYYAPSEGKYGRAGGLFSGSGTSGFDGSLRLTEKFAEMVTDNKAVVAENAQQVAQNMQKQFEGKAQATANAAGTTPIRVRLPIEGKLFKLEKILALQGDELFFDVEYSDWKAAK
jgi:biotin carboxyl carrier protein